MQNASWPPVRGLAGPGPRASGQIGAVLPWSRRGCRDAESGPQRLAGAGAIYRLKIKLSGTNHGHQPASPPSLEKICDRQTSHQHTTHTHHIQQLSKLDSELLLVIESILKTVNKSDSEI